ADAVPVEVRLVMTDQTLLNYGAAPGDPAHLNGYGPVPAELARRIAGTGAKKAGLWLRRLFTNPETGALVAMESRRCFDDGLADVLIVRDQICRTPWCGAPIRHKDHVIPFEDGGATSEANGQGLCEACNYAKQAAGWAARATGGGAGEEVEITTPTGHRYRSRPPPLSRGTPPSPAESILADIIWAA
ncbi:MAG: HNH endonuclease, partial [Nocardioidaceae bacterium]